MKRLERNQMKLLKGGVLASPIGSSCQYENPDGESVITCMTQQEAQNASQTMGGHWCCASCSTATWSNKTPNCGGLGTTQL